MSPSPQRPILEVAVADVDDAVIAEQCGADRLELNSAMPLGGLTPSMGVLREVLAAVRIPVVVMVRPRPGGFCYTANQWKTVLRDTEMILEAGAAGIVCGALDAERNIDAARITSLQSVVGTSELVFHRAFDLAEDWRQALETLIDLGVKRILSSGQQQDVVAGADCLLGMLQQANRRIEVIAGSGVRLSTLPKLQAVGLHQFHGTFSRAIEDPGYDAARFRFAVNDQSRGLDENELRAVRACLC